MAHFLKVQVGDVDLRREGYAPEGWQIRENREESRLKLHDTLWKGLESGDLINFFNAMQAAESKKAAGKPQGRDIA